MLYNIAKFVATFCYLGKSKIAPGTIGSLAAFPLCYVLMWYVLNNQIIIHFSILDQYEPLLAIVSVIIIELLVTIALFIAGTYFTAIYIKNIREKDPKEVVIDEVAGQMLTIIFCYFSTILIHFSSSLPKKIGNNYTDFIFLFLLPFVLFRLFDIIKPWPIKWLDQNIKGAFGVMIDDIAAAIFAIVSQYVIVLIILDKFPLK